jgi:hypothetical protein
VENSSAPEVLSFAVPLATFVVLIMLKSGNLVCICHKIFNSRLMKFDTDTDLYKFNNLFSDLLN